MFRMFHQPWLVEELNIVIASKPNDFLFFRKEIPVATK